MTELERSQADSNIAKARMFNSLGNLFDHLSSLTNVGIEAIRKEIANK